MSGVVFYRGEAPLRAEKLNAAFAETKQYVDARISTSGGIIGPPGPPGPLGNTGPQGAPGPTGATGAQGPTGATGATGPQGSAGVTGAQGPQGSIGPQGATGPQGPAGATGTVAIAGTAPTLTHGALWFDSIGARLYIGYNDGNTTQWVAVA